MEERAQKAVPLKVLVVDDDPSLLQLLETALTAIDNYEVQVADCADTAIDLIEEATKPFDCILLDVQMPETNGIVLLRGIREIPEYTDTPILMLTAMSDRRYVDDAFLAGATDYITKPFDMMDLRGRMNSARRLVHERHKTESKQRAVRILKNELDRQNYFEFDDPFSINQAGNHLRFSEFNNYVDLLSRGRLFRSSAIAMKLQGAQALYNATSCGFFRKAVLDTAYCLQKATEELECMFSYRGSGVFVAVVHDDASLNAFPAAEKLNATLHAMRGERRAKEGWVNLLIGEPVSMRSLSRTAASGAIKRAVEQIEEVEQRLGATNLKPVGDVATQADTDDEEDAEPRKALYERVLLELYGSESYLNLK